MPARVHALLVARSDGAGDRAMAHLERTIEALAAQSRRVDALTVVVIGQARPRLHELVARAGAEAVIEAPRSTGYAAALRMGSVRLGRADAVWLLAQDTAPDPAALRRLAGALELAPSVSMVAPKLVAWDESDRIVSLGVSMTRLGRSVGLVDGQLDQGQHDIREDALGADVRGLLVRREAWDLLRGLDPALWGADEGLDLGVRSRLVGGRVGLVPGARIAVAGDGVAALPDPRDVRRRGRRAAPLRVAQLHRRLAYARSFLVPLIWLSLLPLALGRTVMHLLRKQPGLVGAEWRATMVVLVRLGAIARSRRRITDAGRASGIRVPWSQLAPLRVRRAELVRRFDDSDEQGDDVDRRGELHFFTGGGAWVVLAAFAVGIGAFFSLLAWSTLGGGGLLPLHDRLDDLWMDAAYGRRGLGLDTTGAADPFSAVLALLGSLTPWRPSQALVILWVLAIPAAALGGWFAATRLSPRAGVRIVGASLWALAPPFLVALTDGRPAPVLAHLLLPWLFYAGSVAKRSWGSTGAASLLLAAVLACAPSLAPALAVLWLAAIATGGRGALRVVWTPLPAIALFGPLIWERGIRGGDWWGLLADPGLVTSSSMGADAASRALLALGVPAPDLAGWASLAPGSTPWIALLLAPLAVVALAALLTPRWAAALALLGTAVLGLATAFAVVGIAVQTSAGEPIALWPGPALSLLWLGVGGAALLTLDTPLPVRMRALRPWAAAAVLLGIIAFAVPQVTAPIRGETALTNGPASTLPAYVAAVGRDDPDIATIVLRPLDDGSVASRVVWGAGETLTAQTTALGVRTQPTASDRDTAALVADLVSPSSADLGASLRERAIGFVVLTPGEQSEAATALRLQAVASLDARAGLESVGDTTRGQLWRVTGDPEPRAGLAAGELALQRGIILAQLGIVAIAVLLAFPTVASRRAARSRSRLVGVPGESRRRAERSRRRRGEPRRRAVAPAAGGAASTSEEIPPPGDAPAEAEAEAETSPEIEGNPEAETGSEADTTPGAETGSEAEANPEAETGSEPEANPEAESGSETVADQDLEAGQDLEADEDLIADPNPEAAPGPGAHQAVGSAGERDRDEPERDRDEEAR
ncbi:glycosyl transferase [Microbacterium limosum]|uniref:Glycosyl transferase n=1 Tax=Microbacterium limosum TaxID=3079935 RepID=A0AAU0MFN8_9MICO|nr:glycosyl transferase [Microbacterium sp. Y20]WOQ68794.1 glycosyl transferase [Microbacterium sp. Y20]